LHVLQEKYRVRWHKRFCGKVSVTGEGGGIYCYSPTVLTISYSEVEGGQDSVYVEEDSILNWGPGMIDADPRLVSLYGFDCLLHPFSPCVDAGNPLIEDGVSDWHPRWPEWYPNSLRSDMGAYGGPGSVGWLP